MPKKKTRNKPSELEDETWKGHEWSQQTRVFMLKLISKIDLQQKL